ncbi:hypothetical protein JCM8097_006892 [Rhodosporidiobolus ruineniae]
MLSSLRVRKADRPSSPATFISQEDAEGPSRAPSRLEQHRASLVRRSSFNSPTSSRPSSPAPMAAVASPVVLADFRPSPLMSPAACAYARPAASSAGKSSKKGIFRRVSRNVASPFSSAQSTPQLSYSPYSSSGASSPAIRTPPSRSSATCSPVSTATKEEKKEKPRRLPRKAVPRSPDLRQLEQEHEEQENQRPTRRSRPSSPEVVDGLWTSTCDYSPTSSPTAVFPSSSSRRSSGASSQLSYAAPIDPRDGDRAILLSASRRRSSVPSPAVLAANAALSPRLARIVAFTSTVSRRGSKDDDATVDQHALETSFDLPEIELPWLPTLFPSGTPLLSSPSSPAPGPEGTPSLLITDACPTCYPSSTHSHHSYSSSSSSSFSSHSSSSTLPTPPSASPAPSSPKNKPAASSFRQSLFRVQAANGAHLVISSDLPLSLSLSSTSPKSTYQILDRSPPLPSLDFEKPGQGGEEWDEHFVDALSTPMKEEVLSSSSSGSGGYFSSSAVTGKGEEGAASASWTELDDEEGEVLVISRTPRLT